MRNTMVSSPSLMANCFLDRVTFYVRRGPGAPNMISAQLSQRIRIWWPRKTLSHHFDDFDKMDKKMPYYSKIIFSHFRRIWNFCKRASSIRKIWWETPWSRWSCMANHFVVSPKFCPKMVTRAPKNGPRYSLQIPIIIQIDPIQPPWLFVAMCVHI